MLASFSLRALAALGLALITLSACSASKDAAEDAPKFTVNGTTQRSEAVSYTHLTLPTICSV